MSVNVSQLVRLSDKLADVKAEMNELSNSIVKKLGADTLSLTISATPVDTGTLRKGWDASPVNDIDDSTKQVVISNQVPYAEYVEYGHRTANHKKWVEGQFMATRSAQIVQAHAEQTAKEVVIKKINEVLNG
nr:MAG TPA: putative tail component [Bacteriophage sp.]